MKKIAILAGVLVLLGGVLPAFSQQTKPVGFSVRAGAFFPTDSTARNRSRTWLIGGLEYKIGDLNFGTTDNRFSSSYSISVDGYAKSGYRNIPVLINWVGRSDAFFFSAGVGVGFTRIPVGTGTETKTRFAYQIGVGYDFATGNLPIFLEAKYFGTAETRVNGFAIMAGIRF